MKTVNPSADARHLEHQPGVELRTSAHRDPDGNEHDHGTSTGCRDTGNHARG